MVKNLIITIILLDGWIFEKIAPEDKRSNDLYIKRMLAEQKVTFFSPSSPQAPLARFCPAERNKHGRDFYSVNDRLEWYLMEYAWATFKHMEGHQLYSEPEILLALAVHEVRHKVQFRLPIKLIGRSSRPGDKFLNAVIRSVEEDIYVFNTRIIEKPEDMEREFDAFVIERLVGESYRENGCSLDKIAGMLLTSI